MTSSHRKKVAIVGSGSAGIAALWALNRTYHDVYLYEAAERLGGHANTVQCKVGRYSTAIDAGFVVLNPATYPNFFSFLNRLGVKTRKAPTSFTVSRDYGNFEWGSRSFSSLLCQRRNIFSLMFWRMLFDIIRFNYFCLDILIREQREPRSWADAAARHPRDHETISDYLTREGYSDAFRNNYLLPLIAAIWSTGPNHGALLLPASLVVRFFWNQGLLSALTRGSDWLTLSDGAKSYVDAVMKGFPPNHLHMKTPIRHVSNDADGRVVLSFEDGRSETFDHVILATSGEEALSLIAPTATVQERQILSCFRTQQNEVVLHSDPALMPLRRRAWSSWNYITESSPSERKANSDKVCVTYNTNLLQGIPKDPFGDIFITINPLHRPLTTKTKGRFYYSQPLYTPSSVRAQKVLGEIQNTRGISFAGAWTGYGTHEDGFSSGLRVAQEHLGAKLPFELLDSTYAKGQVPRFGVIDHVVRLLLLVVQVFLIQMLGGWLHSPLRGRDPSWSRLKRAAMNGKAS